MKATLSDGTTVRIIFRHTQFSRARFVYDDNPNPKQRKIVEKIIPVPLPKRRAVTECAIITGSKKDGDLTVLYAGTAECSWDDPFHKETGRQKSLANAMRGAAILVTDIHILRNAYVNRARTAVNDKPAS